MDHLFARHSVYLFAQLRIIRHSLKISASEFAQRCTLSVTTIKRLENEMVRKPPSKVTWNKINLYLKRIGYFEKHAGPALDPRVGKTTQAPPHHPQESHHASAQQVP